MTIMPAALDWIGRTGNKVKTLILDIKDKSYGIESYYVDAFEDCVDDKEGTKGVVPAFLVGTELGKRILEDLKDIKFSHSEDNMFCHNALYYKSSVAKDNKLVGIRNWQYVGFYVLELEDAIHRYLEYI